MPTAAHAHAYREAAVFACADVACVSRLERLPAGCLYTA
jgi:hypothetical protein